MKLDLPPRRGLWEAVLVPQRFPASLDLLRLRNRSQNRSQQAILLLQRRVLHGQRLVRRRLRGHLLPLWLQQPLSLLLLQRHLHNQFLVHQLPFRDIILSRRRHQRRRRSRKSKPAAFPDLLIKSPMRSSIARLCLLICRHLRQPLLGRQTKQPVLQL